MCLSMLLDGAIRIQLAERRGTGLPYLRPLPGGLLDTLDRWGFTVNTRHDPSSHTFSPGSEFHLQSQGASISCRLVWLDEPGVAHNLRAITPVIEIGSRLVVFSTDRMLRLETGRMIADAGSSHPTPPRSSSTPPRPFEGFGHPRRSRERAALEGLSEGHERSLPSARPGSGRKRNRDPGPAVVENARSGTNRRQPPCRSRSTVRPSIRSMAITSDQPNDRPGSPESAAGSSTIPSAETTRRKSSGRPISLASRQTWPSIRACRVQASATTIPRVVPIARVAERRPRAW